MVRVRVRVTRIISALSSCHLVVAAMHASNDLICSVHVASSSSAIASCS